MTRVIILAATVFGLAGGAGVAVSTPAPASAQASAGPPYRSCAEARKDGRSNILRDDPAYSSKLDRDGDGIACESKP